MLYVNNFYTFVLKQAINHNSYLLTIKHKGYEYCK